jgi:hypothetical protein
MAATPEGAVPVGVAFPDPHAAHLPDDQVLDLDAFAPVPRWVRKGGMAYSMRSFFDIKGSDLAALFRLEDEARDDPGRGLPAIQRRQVALIVPDMPEHVLQDLSQQELIAVINEGWTYRRPPQMAPPVPGAAAPMQQGPGDPQEVGGR